MRILQVLRQPSVSGHGPKYSSHTRAMFEAIFYMLCLKFSCMPAVRPDRRNAAGMDVAMMSLILIPAFEKLGSSITAMTEQTRLTNERHDSR